MVEGHVSLWVQSLQTRDSPRKGQAARRGKDQAGQFKSLKPLLPQNGETCARRQSAGGGRQVQGHDLATHHGPALGVGLQRPVGTPHELRQTRRRPQGLIDPLASQAINLVQTRQPLRQTVRQTIRQTLPHARNCGNRQRSDLGLGRCSGGQRRQPQRRQADQRQGPFPPHHPLLPAPRHFVLASGGVPFSICHG